MTPQQGAVLFICLVVLVGYAGHKEARSRSIEYILKHNCTLVEKYGTEPSPHTQNLHVSKCVRELNSIKQHPLTMAVNDIGSSYMMLISFFIQVVRPLTKDYVDDPVYLGAILAMLVYGFTMLCSSCCKPRARCKEKNCLTHGKDFKLN